MSRNDATADFEASLDCKPADSLSILLVPVRDGRIGAYIFITLSGDEPSTTVTVPIGSEQQLSIAIGWAPELANRTAQGDVAYTDWQRDKSELAAYFNEKLGRDEFTA